ncbi:MAG: Fe-S cluster assembly sulfur transfer protein SufU [Brevinema sp.]
MSDLSALYQEIILEHSRKPRNFGVLTSPPAMEGLGLNPSCGDKLVLYVQLDDDKIADIRHNSEGCAIFKASCSLMSSFLIGKTSSEAQIILELYLKLITLDEADLLDEDLKKLGKLAVFQNIRNYPARVKCAALFVRTMQNILNGGDEAVNTEEE